MKSLITIAATLLAGATPFAASAALGKEAATTAAAQETVIVRRVADDLQAQSEARELAELRLAIQALRAEKDQLRAELDAQRVDGSTRSELESNDLRKRLAEVRSITSESAQRVRAGADEGRALLELRARLAETQDELSKHQAEVERWVVRESATEGSGGIAYALKADEHGRWEIVTENILGDERSLPRGLARVRSEQDEGSALRREVRKFKIADDSLIEVDPENVPQDAERRRVIVRSGSKDHFAILEPADAGSAQEVETELWIDVENGAQADPRGPSTRLERRVLRATPDVDIEVREAPTSKVFMVDDDGQFVEIDVTSATPTVPAVPRAPLAVGGGGAAPPAARRTITWSQSGSGSGAGETPGRDELLREVHLLTKEMLAELRLLRAAVDELRSDVNAQHSAATGGGANGPRRR